MNEKNLPFFNLSLRPVWKDNKIGFMDVNITVEKPCIAEGAELCAINLNTVTIPFCDIQDGMRFYDDNGEIGFTVTENEAGHVKKASYAACRDTLGNISLKYRILPRIQPENYKSSPYFDFVCEEGCANGAGLTFLPLIGEKDEIVYNFNLTWDLKEMPAGTRGLWCRGEGDISAV